MKCPPPDDDKSAALARLETIGWKLNPFLSYGIQSMITAKSWCDKTDTDLRTISYMELIDIFLQRT